MTNTDTAMQLADWLVCASAALFALAATWWVLYGGGDAGRRNRQAWREIRRARRAGTFEHSRYWND
jgi:hypothetical protein